MKTFGIAALIAVGLVLSACAGQGPVSTYGMWAAERYCEADDLGRAALRAQFDRGDGPVFQVNCENL